LIDCCIILIKFPTHPILAGQAIKVWFTSQRTVFGKLQKKKSGQARKDPTFRQKWVLDNFSFLKSHLVVRAATRTMGDSSMRSSHSCTHAAAAEEEEEDGEEHPSLEESPMSQRPAMPSLSTEGGSQQGGTGPITTSTLQKALKEKRKKTSGGPLDDCFRRIADNLCSNVQMQERVSVTIHCSSALIRD
jgi:hypothetical protein